MKFLLSTLFLVLFLSPVNAQSDTHHQYPDGIYRTLDDFTRRLPDTITQFRKLNAKVPASMAFADTLVDHVLFLDQDHDVIKKIFAVVHKGEIYFQEWGIRNALTEDFRHRSITFSPTLHRVKERGRYYYGEATYKIEDPGATVAMGMMFGILGAVAGSAMTKDSEVIAPFVYDSAKKRFFIFVTRPQLKLFMEIQHPEYPIDIERGRQDAEAVRNLFVELNKGAG